MSIYGHDLNSEDIVYESDIILEDGSSGLSELGKELLKIGLKGIGGLLKAIGIFVTISIALTALLIHSSEKDEKKRKDVADKINKDTKIKNSINEAVKNIQKFIFDNMKNKKYIKSRNDYTITKNNITVRKTNVTIHIPIMEVYFDEIFKDITKKDWKSAALEIAKDKYEDTGYDEEDENYEIKDIEQFFEDNPDDYGLLPFGQYQKAKESINNYLKEINDIVNKIPFNRINKISLKTITCANNYDEDDYNIEYYEICYFDDFHYNCPSVIFLDVTFNLK